MMGIDRMTSCHYQNIDPTFTPQRQKRRAFNSKIYRAPKKEVEKLIFNHQRDHLSKMNPNPILVKKHNDKWRICIDFSNLNQACTKDSFPL